MNIILDEFSFSQALQALEQDFDAVLVVNAEENVYKTLKSKGFFESFLGESGKYEDLCEKLWFHLSKSDSKIYKDYHVFMPMMGKYQGKHSKRLKITHEEIAHAVQMTSYPIEDSSLFLLVLDELDSSESTEEVFTDNKVNTIQNTYLFSMYVDLLKDTTSSISITEISDETMSSTQLKYTDWRMMIVNMIWPEDKDLFLERTDPDYLKKHFSPGQTLSFDCQMMNLEGKYIWVKLIFCRAATNNEDDFRFVFMVQDIHENLAEMMDTLKQYEEMASKDALTSLFNHGRIETEILNAIEHRKRSGEPVAMMMLDIDFFKRVNDDYGHSVGDITLSQFARTLSQELQKYNSVIGRWGGEEFVVVCYNTSQERLQEIAEEFRETIEKESFSRVGKLTCSIGVTEIYEKDELDQAFERMDKALYAAKQGGRNCVKSA